MSSMDPCGYASRAPSASWPPARRSRFPPAPCIRCGTRGPAGEGELADAAGGRSGVVSRAGRPAGVGAGGPQRDAEPLAFGVLLSEYRDVFRLAGPDAVLRPALALLGAIGRARGYRATSGSNSALSR